jgi:hypothetical protein
LRQITPANHTHRILVRRSILDTPDVYGTWNAATRALQCGPGNWQLLDSSIWNWKPCPGGTLPDWPVPHAAPGWRDPWLNPPPDQAVVWVRRFYPFSAAQMATWDLAATAYRLAASANLLPWHAVFHWKPC